MNQLTGTIKIIQETKAYGSNGFTKREFVITTDEKYTQEVKLELYKDDCTLLDEFSIGDKVDATFNIKGNEYKGNYYVNLQAWKLTESASSESTDAPAEESAVEGDAPKKRGRPKKVKEPELAEEDLTENITELADAPF